MTEITFNWPDDWIEAFTQMAGRQGIPLDPWVVLTLRAQLTPEVNEVLSLPSGVMTPQIPSDGRGQDITQQAETLKKLPTFHEAYVARYAEEIKNGKIFRQQIGATIKKFPLSLRGADDSQLTLYLQHLGVQ